MNKQFLPCSPHHEALYSRLKQQLHQSMNGVAAESMKAKGADYRLIYGVAYPQLKTMAKAYPNEEAFARLLWSSNIREMMILATMVWPSDSFPEETAEEWVHSLKQLELIEQACLNLFPFLPYASRKALEWIGEEGLFVQIAGYTLIYRLSLKGVSWNEKQLQHILKQAGISTESTSSLLVNATMLALRGLVRQGKEQGDKVIQSFLDTGQERLTEVATQLKYEQELL